MLCIHFFSQKYFLNTYLILSIVQGCEDKIVNKLDKVHF